MQDLAGAATADGTTDQSVNALSRGTPAATEPACFASECMDPCPWRPPVLTVLSALCMQVCTATAPCLTLSCWVATTAGTKLD